MTVSIESKNENGVLTVILGGRIDSANATEVEERIRCIRDENTHTSIVIDAEGLQYVSSAGLRIFLRIRKSDPSMKIIRASSDIYDILEITGFTGIIEVEKA